VHGLPVDHGREIRPERDRGRATLQSRAPEILEPRLRRLFGLCFPTTQFWITLIAIFATCAGLNVILVTQLTTPLKDLTSALTHVSDEPNNITPPNPNARHFERDGFKPLLQIIYELASDKSELSEVEEEEKAELPTAALATAVNTTATGFVIMNAQKEISFANSSAVCWRISGFQCRKD